MLLSCERKKSESVVWHAHAKFFFLATVSASLSLLRSWVQASRAVIKPRKDAKSLSGVVLAHSIVLRLMVLIATKLPLSLCRAHLPPLS